MEDDLELLGRWQGGDQKAGKLLFERHFDGLYRFFSSKAAQDVEDLIQQTLLACVEKGGDIESFRPYLYGTARHILFDFYRKRTRGRFDPAESSLEDIAPSPSRALAAEHESRLLAAALRQIPIELQIVLEMYYWEHLTHRELATVLGITPGMVKGKIATAKKRFRECLVEIREGRGFNALSAIDLDAWAASLARAAADAVRQDMA